MIKKKIALKLVMVSEAVHAVRAGGRGGEGVCDGDG